MKKRIMRLMLALCVCCLALLPGKVQAAQIAGGTDVNGYTHWSLDDAGTLTITGNGPVRSWEQPWSNYLTDIEKIVIKDGITDIGAYVFAGCTNLKTVTIPGSVDTIGSQAFRDCTSLTTVTISSGVTEIGNMAFLKGSSLTGITIPATVTPVESSVFEYCSGLTPITIPVGVTHIGKRVFLLVIV